MMTTFRTLALTAALAATALTACTTAPAAKILAGAVQRPAVAQTTRAKNTQTEAEARAAAVKANYAHLDEYKKSNVGLWTGMTHDQFEAQTTKRADGFRQLKVGKREFVIAVAKFGNNGLLESAVEGYGGDSKEDVREAFGDYVAAAGHPDYYPDLVQNRPAEAPDVEAEAAEWFGADSDVTVLRVYSKVLAKQVETQMTIPAPAGGVMVAIGKHQ